MTAILSISRKWLPSGVFILTTMLPMTILTLAQSHQAGDIKRDEYGVEMVYVPGGTFTLGIDAERLKALCEQRGEPDADQCVEIIREDSGATYLQTVEIQPFWIDRFEVTIELFNEFCGRVAYTDVDNCLGEPRDEELTLNAHQPQVGVSWYTADFICRLRYARLPTEAEWEYAASGPEKSVFPWGDNFNPDFIQHPDPQYPQTYPVGTIPENRSWVGTFDLTGNVAEWTDDRFAPRILSNISPEEWPTPVPGNIMEINRVLRGGGWNSPFWHYTNFYRADGSSDLLGFRCARSLMAD
jgi:formylglycine-generating enzyme required for sulfatase activity